MVISDGKERKSYLKFSKNIVSTRDTFFSFGMLLDLILLGYSKKHCPYHHQPSQDMVPPLGSCGTLEKFLSRLEFTYVKYEARRDFIFLLSNCIILQLYKQPLFVAVVGCKACRILAPGQGWNLRLLQWQYGVLTAGSPRKSLNSLISGIFIFEDLHDIYKTSLDNSSDFRTIENIQERQMVP